MDYFHCNRCAHLPQFVGQQDQRRYFISSCGHVFCQNCAINSKEVCVICKTNCSLVEINAQSKSEIKMYFMDPSTVLRENLKNTAQVFAFQKSQIKSFQSVLVKLMETHKRTLMEMNTLKNNCTKLEQENLTLKTKIETMEQEHQNWIGCGLPASNEDTGAFSIDHRGLNTPQSFSNIFGNPTSGGSSTFQGRGFLNTPENQTPFGTSRNMSHHRNALFTSNPPNQNFTNHSSSGDGIYFGPGRLTMPRTPNSQTTPISERFSPATPKFSAAPGSGRSKSGPTPDVVSRLRQLRCSASTPGLQSQYTPVPRL